MNEKETLYTDLITTIIGALVIIWALALYTYSLIKPGIEFSYITEGTREIALKMRKEGTLVEMQAPLILVNGKQIKHEDIKKTILGGNA